MPRMKNLDQTRRRFMSTFAATSLGTTLVPGVLWARMQDAGASRVSLAMVTDSLKLAGIEDTLARTVLLVRQFRLPAYLNGYDDLLIDAAAGLLDDAQPEVRIRAEVEEELGYRLGAVRKVFEAFMSPGSVTEILHFFVAEYDASMRIGDGGGHPDEGEDIEVLEPTVDEARAMIADGRIRDAKTIMLLQHLALTVFR